MSNPHDQPVPSREQPVSRIRALAADLAYGALSEFWGAELPGGFNPTSSLGSFLVKKWNNAHPSFELLVSFGYLKWENKYGTSTLTLTQKAFDLLENIPPGIKVFISYGRTKSSAFALALQYKLTALRVEAFLDKEIDLGDDWHARLQAKITEYEYFIPILAPGTLDSPIVRKEIKWAYEAHRACIPVWHSGFSAKIHLNSNSTLEESVKQYIQAKNACIVDGEEKAAIYDNAINNIINQLGYT